jgi:hypothetical protein
MTPVADQVASSGMQMGLNFVLAWDAQIASLLILQPTVASLIICVVWPIVSVLKYQVDVQTSVQTATSLASYIVTAGKT